MSSNTLFQSRAKPNCRLLKLVHSSNIWRQRTEIGFHLRKHLGRTANFSMLMQPKVFKIYTFFTQDHILCRCTYIILYNPYNKVSTLGRILVNSDWLKKTHFSPLFTVTFINAISSKVYIKGRDWSTEYFLSVKIYNYNHYNISFLPKPLGGLLKTCLISITLD